MAKAKTKQELVAAANDQFEKLWDLVNSLSEEQQRGTFEFDGKEAHWQRDKNIRDILVHLYEWHQLLLKWVASNQAGVEAQFLREPYNWKTYGEMNVDFWNEHQETTYEDSIKMLNKSHQDVLDLIDKFSDKELLEKDVFSWVGGSTLGQYCSSATSSHYDWAIKKIKRYKKDYCS